MKRQRRRKCKHCKRLFHPEPRNAWHQEFCEQAECRGASRQAAQAKWRRKPENRDYFCGPHQVERVRSWRADHPGYWKSTALQDVLMSEVPDPSTESGTYKSTNAGTRQDILPSQEETRGKEIKRLPISTEPSLVGNEKIPALQDVLAVGNGGQTAVLIGIIGKLIGTTLQDDIATAATSLLRLGKDILHGGLHGRETAFGAREGAAHTERQL
jgi:hypothetical protein